MSREARTEASSERLPEVEMEVPRVLEPIVGRVKFRVRANTVSGVLEAACRRFEALRHHLFTDSGDLRPHILVLLNEVNLDRRVLATTSVESGDEVLLHQAISGG